MRVLVVGSERGLPDEKTRKLIHQAGEQLGACLAERGHDVLVGADDPADVDSDVVKGALSSSRKVSVEVHRMKGSAECYTNHPHKNQIKICPHRYSDWDVTVLEVLRQDAHAVITLGGRTGVVQTGVAGWMLGRAVLPIGWFGGGGSTVWGYGSGARDQFYFGALTDHEIDQLNTPWDDRGVGTSAKSVVLALERVHRRASEHQSDNWLLVGVSGLVLLALIVWVVMLATPAVGALEVLVQASVGAAVTPERLAGYRFALLLASVCTAGALMQTLRGIRDSRPATWRLVAIELVLGIPAGFLSATLYLIAQIAITGKLELPQTDADFVRIALVVGLAALFSSLYLDAALARFDSLRARVMAGTHGSQSNMENTTDDRMAGTAAPTSYVTGTTARALGARAKSSQSMNSPSLPGRIAWQGAAPNPTIPEKPLTYIKLSRRNTNLTTAIPKPL